MRFNLTASSMIPTRNNMTSGGNFMRCPFIITFIWLATVFSGYGALPEVSVTPTNLNLHDYTFFVSTNSAQDGTAFHVVITAKTHDIPPNSSVNLEAVMDGIFFEDTGKPRQMGRAAPPIKVTLKKNPRVWEADFMVPRHQLEETRLFCLFAEGYDGETGGILDEKTVTFYEIRIQDFINPSMTFWQPSPITRNDLVAMWKRDTNWMGSMPAGWATPHYYYMGTGKISGYDYIAIAGGPHSAGGGSYISVAVRAGELPIDNRHSVSNTVTVVTGVFAGPNSFTDRWQEIDMSKL
jgi:hypothetical protein